MDGSFSQDLRKRKLKRKNKYSSVNWRRWIVIIIVCFLFFRYLYVNIFQNKVYNVMLPFKYQTLIDTEALIIRDEYVYSENQSPQNIQDKHIPVKEEIGTLSKYQNNSGLLLDGIDSKIHVFQNLKKNFTENLNNHANIQDQIISVRNWILEGNFLEIQKNVQDNYSNFGYSLTEIQALEDQLAIEKEVQEKQGQNLTALISGILSTDLDGYEGIYNYSNKSHLDILPFVKGKEDVLEKKGFKIIDNSEVTLRFAIDTNHLLNVYNQGSEIKIKFDNHVISGIVEKMDIKDKETVFNILIAENTDLFMKNRYIPIQLVNYETEAFKIPKSCLTELYQQQGVFVKKDSQVVSFEPVEVLGTDDHYVYIKSGHDGEVLINGKEKSSVKPYDQIITKPSLVHDGELLD